ncbi:SRPBCC family protein [Sciscionella marina]|uniref:SRPBCC family protein n=1 Tax=Sciscionella marina TaxID=508770 RepID=UPI0003AAA186|nr:SRPBCC family protein [Sciscionella marina]
MESTGLRLAEAPSVEVDRWIAAAPERVWELVSDVTAMPAMSTELQAAEWLDGASGPALGARFRGHNRNDILGDWSTDSQVIECIPGQVFAWAVSDPDNPNAVWRFRLEPENDGTRLRQYAQLGPGPSGLTLAIARMPEKEDRILRRRLRDVEQFMTDTLDHVKTTAEA